MRCGKLGEFQRDCVVLTAGRFYARGWIVRKFGVDDFFIALAVVGCESPKN